MPTLQSTAGPIVCATVAAVDASAVADAYARCLGWGELDSSVASPGLAASWGAPELDGARVLLLGTAGRSEGLVRVVELGAEAGDGAAAGATGASAGGAGSSAAGDGPAPGAYLQAPGWRSIEICVTDVHAVRRRLEDAAFRIVGEPEPLPGSETIHAMQAIGPAGELLYLTELGPQDVYELPTPVEPVDRVFIAVASAPDLNEARAWWASRFGAVDPAGAVTVPIGSVNNALGLDASHVHSFCGLQIAGRNLVEVDGHPAELLGGSGADGADADAAGADGAAAPPLRAGVASFTFELAGSLEDLGVPLLAPPAAFDGAPYSGRRSGTIIGPAGERIELIERG